MTVISSLHNPRVKRALKLRQSRARRQLGRILIEGARELTRAIEAGVVIEEVLYLPDALDSSDGRHACDLLPAETQRKLELLCEAFEVRLAARASALTQRRYIDLMHR